MMSLAEYLPHLELLRALQEPSGERPVCIVIPSRELRRLSVWLRRREHLRVSHIIVADAPAGAKIEASLPASWGSPAVMGGLASLVGLAACDKVFLFTPEWLVRVASMGIPALGGEAIFIPATSDPALARRTPLPGYYGEHAASLEKAWTLLHAGQDRDVFARRVKALMTGDPGYLRVASHAEYDHPLVALEPGDVLLDGGLSDMVECQEAFARKVGETGLVHGFEPIPWMAEKAAEQLKPCPWYHVHALGLADREGEARFASLRDSSHLAASDCADGVDCRLTTMDAFVGRAGLSRVDAIKLDVEGAELAALRGAQNLIRSHHPKLIVCLYHKPRDLFEIPLWLHQLAPGYEMRLAHSSCGFTDTILYARVPGARK